MTMTLMLITNSLVMGPSLIPGPGSMFLMSKTTSPRTTDAYPMYKMASVGPIIYNKANTLELLHYAYIS